MVQVVACAAPRELPVPAWVRLVLVAFEVQLPYRARAWPPTAAACPPRGQAWHPAASQHPQVAAASPREPSRHRLVAAALPRGRSRPRVVGSRPAGAEASLHAAAASPRRRVLAEVALAAVISAVDGLAAASAVAGSGAAVGDKLTDGRGWRPHIPARPTHQKRLKQPLCCRPGTSRRAFCALGSLVAS